MPAHPNHYALVIGIDDYPDYGARRKLNGAVRDAERFAEWLCDTNTGGGLPQANCRLIRSNGNSRSPIHDDIDLALEQIWKAAIANQGERFYFYFSGHGLSSDSHNVALCLANWSVQRRHAALSSSLYLEFLIQCTPFREIIVFLDCCRLRQGVVIGRPSELGCPVPIDGVGGKRHLIGYATEFTSAAFEAPGAEGAEVRGHFTEALLAALKGAAASQTGGVTAAALKDYLEKNVSRIASASNHNQIPQVPFDLPAGTLFGSALPGGNCVIRFSPARAGAILLEGPNLQKLRQGNASTGPWTVALQPGLHCLSEIGTGERLFFRFNTSEALGDVTF